MNRWTVTAHQSHRNGSKCPKSRWVVDPPGFDYKRRAEHTSNWHRAGGKWFQWGGEFTKREAWEAALAYADRMARTVRFTFPRIAEKQAIPSKSDSKREPPLVVENKGRMTWLKQNGDEVDGLFVILDKDQLKPLALALLALHYRTVDNPH